MRIPGLSLAFDGTGVVWRPTRSRGVSWFPLEPRVEAGAGGGGAVLIRMEPGCGYPPHRHLEPGEEVLVLEGGYEDERGLWRAGDWVAYEAGSTHSPRALGDPDLPVGPSNPACVLLAVARGGTERLSPH